MKVTITSVLNKDAHDAYREAHKRASEAHIAHLQAEHDAFMALMAEIGVGIGDKVTIRRETWNGQVSHDAILTGAKRFAQIKKDGTASMREHHVYGEYTVEKFHPTPE